jgi:hypothetical protein
MQKTAQSARQTGRGFFNKLRETTNISGMAAEKFFTPQFQEVMDSIRQVDGNVRSIATGKAVDGGEPGEDSSSMKDLLKQAKSNINRNEYMTAVGQLGRFHKKVADIVAQFKLLNTTVDKVHHQFLFDKIDEKGKDDTIKHLRDLQKRMAETERQKLVKEGTFADFLYKVLRPDERGKALRFYEKRFPKEYRALKVNTEKLLTSSENLYNQVITSLKEMASARAKRDVNNYVKSFEKINGKYSGYDTQFKEYYATNIKKWEDFFKEQAAQEPGPTAKMPDANLGKQEIPDLDLPASKVPVAPGVSTTGPTTPAPPPNGSFDPENLGNIGFPRLPSNLGPAVPITPPPDTDPNMTLPPDTFHRPTPTMMGVAPPANRQQTIGYKPISKIPKPPGAPGNPGASVPVEGLPPFRAHSRFVESLQSLSQEEPRVLAAYIKKYAQSIQEKDLATAIKLFALVKQITG